MDNLDLIHKYIKHIKYMILISQYIKQNIKYLSKKQLHTIYLLYKADILHIIYGIYITVYNRKW